MKTAAKYLTLFLAAFFTSCMALAGPPASAVIRADLKEKVISGLEATYAELAQRFVADLAWDGIHYSGKDFQPVRHAAGSENDKSDPDPAAIDSVKRIDFTEDGGKRMALLFDFAESAETAQGLGVLALYDISKGVRFLDAVDVGLDRWTSFRDPPLLTLSSGAPVLLVDSVHFNSSQSYMFTSLVLAQKERLVPVTTYFTLGWQSCAGRVEQNSSFRAIRAKSKGLPDTIEVTVNVKAEESGDDCNGEKLSAESRKLTVRYEWNRKSGQYRPSSDALQRLEDENMRDL